VNELERPIGTYLYGRCMYETMVFWESPRDLDVRVNLELLDERRFRSGTVYLHYRTRS
jgi:hypothetical protein